MSDQSSLGNGYTDRTYTLSEASRLTGLSVDALRQRIKRGRLETVKGNDGLVRVRLTTADLEAARQNETRQADQSPTSQHPDSDQTIKALQGEVTSLREALVRERERADEAERRAEQERTRTHVATGLADLRAQDLRELGEKLARAEGVVEVSKSDHTRERAEWTEQLARVRAERDQAKAEAADQRVALAKAEGVIEGMKAQPAGGFMAWWRIIRSGLRS